jgi:hypothetical protein
MNRIIITCVVVLLPSWAEARKPDLSGDWTWSATGAWKKGPCPAGGKGTGTLKIKHKGNKVTLVFTSGRSCRPPTMCTFKGKLAGAKLTLANAATVDSEGGKVKNSISMKLKDAKNASGSSTSSYTHPGGMVCRWGSKMAIKKKQ